MSDIPSGLDVAHLLFAAGVRHPPQAASLRRLVRFAVADRVEPTLAALAERCADWSGEVPASQLKAARILAARDLARLLEGAAAAARTIAAWRDPMAALLAARDSALMALDDLGIAPSRPPAIHLVERLPPPYDAPSLAVISIDASDAAAFALETGLYLARPALLPLFAECALAHVLVHVALGERSPEHLGRGLEEGICEVLGGLHAAGACIGADAAFATFAATRFTPSASRHRAAFLDQVRSASYLHQNLGLEGLAAVVRAGRGRVKQLEAMLAVHPPAPVHLARGAPDPALAASLDRLLLATPRPLTVSPIGFLLAERLAAGGTVGDAARALAIDAAVAAEAARELMDGVFVLVLGPEGRVLVHDLEHLLAAGALRYQLPG